MKNFKSVLVILGTLIIFSCTETQKLSFEAYETSAASGNWQAVEQMEGTADIQMKLNPEKTYQTMTGFGGAFTESSSYLLNQLGEENRKKVIDAYFAPEGAAYSLTRTHINSSDFSLGNYAYAPEEDMTLSNFSIEEDMEDVIPFIKDAMATSEDGFKILASPWTAPPWMKDNKDWKGGKLLPRYYDTWALYFSKYIDAYKAQGIDIWGLTVENEPLGNDSNWESMEYTAEELASFVENHLGPSLEENGHQDVVLLGYDQNRDEELDHFTEAQWANETRKKYFDGTAVHWYASTYKYYPELLQMAHDRAPGKYLIQSEACVDAEVPHWHDDAWYWAKEATDWGWTWAPEELKADHPKYVPVYRYARDIIGSMNNWVDGWIDWNMVLDREGGPNWASNWCISPVIVDPDADEVYFTPLYYVMKHFSKYIRPGAERIDFNLSDDSIMATATTNPDGSTVVVLLNMEEVAKTVRIELNGVFVNVPLKAQAIQTLVLNATE